MTTATLNQSTVTKLIQKWKEKDDIAKMVNRGETIT